MNILTDELPTAVEIDGKEYEINTDFRSCLRTILAFEDDTLTAREKESIMLNNLFSKVPENIFVACEKAIRFLDGGEVPEGESLDVPRLYSFSKDAQYIFAAFRQTHGIDLEAVEIHWWKFLALFMDLGSETAFSSLVGLRRRVKTGKATKEERQIAREMGEAFDIPDFDTRTFEEREQEELFLALVNQGAK